MIDLPDEAVFFVSKIAGLTKGEFSNEKQDWFAVVITTKAEWICTSTYFAEACHALQHAIKENLTMVLL